MSRRRANPNLVKIHRSYTVRELADRLGVHKNTVRHWQRHGLTPVDAQRPYLFKGAAVRAFLIGQSAMRWVATRRRSTVLWARSRALRRQPGTGTSSDSIAGRQSHSSGSSQRPETPGPASG